LTPTPTFGSHENVICSGDTYNGRIATFEGSGKHKSLKTFRCPIASRPSNLHQQIYCGSILRHPDLVSSTGQTSSGSRGTPAIEKQPDIPETSTFLQIVEEFLTDRTTARGGGYIHSEQSKFLISIAISGNHAWNAGKEASGCSKTRLAWE
jgi:hypothetical protein